MPYAIIGAFALNEYGHKRVTVGVDLVRHEEHLSEFKRKHLGTGYAERVPGTALRGERFSLLPMARFIELKLASGMVAAHRGKDLVDVQELIKSAGLPASTADDLHPWVRGKFLELWQLAQVDDPF